MAEAFSVLFVCTGNICRSPTADGILRKLIAEAGKDADFTVDSAGTSGFNEGSEPSRWAQVVAEEKGYDLSSLRARKIEAKDFEAFDLLICMDRGHHAQLLALAPEGKADRLRLLLEYAPHLNPRLEVEDPYGGDRADYERAFSLIEPAVKALWAEISTQNSSHS